MEITVADEPTPDEAFDRVTRLIRRIFDVDIALVSLIDGQRQRFKSIKGFQATEVPLEHTFCRTIWKRGEPLLISDTLTNPDYSGHPSVVDGPKVRSYAGVPLRTSDGEMIGTVCAIHTAPRDFTPQEVLVLQDLAQIVSGELELREKASVDALTGIMSRRSYLDESRRLLLWLHRKRLTMSVIVLDIDHFKAINDQFGHDAGDNVLKAVVQGCAGSLREYDLFGRIGGEEFAISLDGDIKQAALICERLRQAIEDLNVTIDDQRLHITISLGAAECSDRFETFDEAVKRADMALYEAKNAGRNRFVCASKPPSIQVVTTRTTSN